MNKKKVKGNRDRRNSSKYFYERRPRTFDPSKEDQFRSDLRYIYMFSYKKTLRRDIITLLKKYNANISVSELISSINLFQKDKKNDNRSSLSRIERRETMNEYIDSIVTSLRRDWEIKKLLKE